MGAKNHQGGRASQGHGGNGHAHDGKQGGKRDSKSHSGHHGHDHGHGGNPNRHSSGHHGVTFPSGSGAKHEEIVPWGWEKALKEDKRRKEEEKRAQQAAQKAAREFDPSMVVKEKSKTGKIEDNKKKGAKVPPATGVNTNTAE